MKTSKRIILSSAGIVGLLLITSLLMVRTDMKILIAESGVEYQTKELSEFKYLDIADKWNVRIKQGRTHQLEFAFEDGNRTEPVYELRNDTLFLGSDSTGMQAVRVLITTRTLETVRAVESSTVRIENFNIDTLNVILDNGGSFSAKNNQVNYISFETSGNSFIDVTETMD